MQSVFQRMKNFTHKKTLIITKEKMLRLFLANRVNESEDYKIEEIRNSIHLLTNKFLASSESPKIFLQIAIGTFPNIGLKHFGPGIRSIISHFNFMSLHQGITR
jgi:hypothetical protein